MNEHMTSVTTKLEVPSSSKKETISKGKKKTRRQWETKVNKIWVTLSERVKHYTDKFLVGEMGGDITKACSFVIIGEIKVIRDRCCSLLLDMKQTTAFGEYESLFNVILT